MIGIKRKEHIVELYDSIEDMPYKRYMKFNKEMMRASEVGNAPDDVLKRIDKTFAYIKSGFYDKAMKELSNARLTFVYATNEIEPVGLALAALVKTIDGVEQTDVSIEGLQRTFDKLQEIGFTKRDIDENTAKVKKKWIPNLKFSLLKRFVVAVFRIIQP